MDVSAVIDRRGNLEMTLRLTVSVPMDTDSLTIPLPFFPDRLTVSNGSASVTEDPDTGVTLVLTSRKGFSAGLTTLEVTLTRDSVLRSGRDAVTMTLPMLSSRWGQAIPAFSFRIELPEAVEADPVYESGYYGELTAEAVSALETGTRISGSVPGGFMAYDSFGVTLNFPEDYFSVPGVLGRYLLTAAGVLNLIALLLGLLTALLLRFFCRVPEPKETFRPRPPDGVTAADLPFLMRGDAPDMAALVLEWAAAGYLTIYARGKRVVLQQRMIMGRERKSWENRLFADLFREGELCELPSAAGRLAFRQARRRCARERRNQIFVRRALSCRLPRITAAAALGCSVCAMICGLSDGVLWRVLLCIPGAAAGILVGLALEYYGGEARVDRNMTVVGALIAVLLVGLIGLRYGAWSLPLTMLCAMLTGKAVVFGDARTAEGLELLRQTLGFRILLRSAVQRRLLAGLSRDPAHFYRLLPWACALELEESLAEHFGDVRMEECGWFSGASTEVTAEEFMARFAPVLRRLRSAAASE